jgi:hypothetical protein
VERLYILWKIRFIIVFTTVKISGLKQMNPSYTLTSYVSKTKVVPVHAMKVYGGMSVQLHSFLTSALDGGA